MKQEIIISPSLLSCDFMNIQTELNYFKKYQNIWFHLDVMDAHFVKNLTFGPPIIKMISKITQIPLDVHLMVTDPLFYIDQLKNQGIHNITFHYEALSKDRIISTIQYAKKFYPSVALSIRPNTPVNVLSDEILDQIDMVLIMSVEPGFGGQKFINESLDKVKYLAQKNIMIQIDGGVNAENASQIKIAGATNLVAGSYIFKDGPEKYFKNISTLAN